MNSAMIDEKTAHALQTRLQRLENKVEYLKQSIGHFRPLAEEKSEVKIYLLLKTGAKELKKRFLWRVKMM